MSRLLDRAALSVAAALGSAYRPGPFSGLFLASASPSAAGHLGLVRARPALLDLNRLLTPEAFLLDATHALGAAALRHKPFSGNHGRMLRSIAPGMRAEEEARGDVVASVIGRVFMALLDAEDGRLGEALDALQRLAMDRPTFAGPRICVAAICELLGRADEGDCWLAGITADHPLREDIIFQNALVAAALGGPPGAIEVAQGAVASAALKFIYEKLWGSASDGGTPVLKKVLVTALLNRVVRAKLNKDAVVAIPGVAKLLRSGTGYTAAPGSADPVFAYAKGTELYVLRATQVLLSAVVLRAAPLSAERIRVATRAAQRELARAMRKKDAGAAADLRLLLAFLAARDGRFQEAGNRYVDAANEHPSDPRPHCLVQLLFLFDEKTEEADRWEASYQRLAAVSSEEDRVAHKSLKEELVIALALGGARTAFSDRYPVVMREVGGAAGSRVDAALLSALRDKDMSIVEEMELRAIRALVYFEMWSAVKDLEMGSGKTAN
ncbi:hypothetical protein EJB05_15762, partial [Eragrostis curvula]